jgi:hypothetical protein
MSPDTNTTVPAGSEGGVQVKATACKLAVIQSTRR